MVTNVCINNLGVNWILGAAFISPDLINLDHLSLYLTIWKLNEWILMISHVFSYGSSISVKIWTQTLWQITCFFPIENKNVFWVGRSKLGSEQRCSQMLFDHGSWKLHSLWWKSSLINWILWHGKSHHIMNSVDRTMMMKRLQII